ncbi:MAG: elongation factor P [Parcubacteria group bacterium]|nr:elongation factor P [Parcubacteria group bacterium]|tara:strand:- start:4866 stop:5429 length:564 start_codon:yes stop_codon:yes gene_type:complete
MLAISDIRQGTICKIGDESYEVIWTQQVQMGRGGSILRIKIKGLVSGKMLEKTLKGSDSLDSADLSRGKVNFLYADQEGYHFMDNESYEQFTFDAEKIGDKKNFLKEGTQVTLLKADDNPLTIQLPIKMEFEVTATAEGVKGDTAQGKVTKNAEIETGYNIQVPLFVKQNETIRINTETGEYVERVG